MLAPRIGACAADIEVSGPDGYLFRLLPSESIDVALSVTNHGPESAPVTLNATRHSLISPGYSIAMGDPACGSLTTTEHEYTLVLGDLPAGATLTCDLRVSRGVDAGSYSDLELDWYYPPSDQDPDPDRANNFADFAIGSLVDVTVEVERDSFEIVDGVAVGTSVLTATNHGPSRVDRFSIGRCFDGFSPPFDVDGEIEGGCGAFSYDYAPICFDIGAGFSVPQLAPGETYSCSFQTTSKTPYDHPLDMTVVTTDLHNPKLGGGALIDTDRSDNRAVFQLAPLDLVFYSGFEGGSGGIAQETQVDSVESAARPK